MYPKCYNTCTKTREQTDRQTNRQRDTQYALPKCRIKVNVVSSSVAVCHDQTRNENSTSCTPYIRTGDAVLYPFYMPQRKVLNDSYQAHMFCTNTTHFEFSMLPWQPWPNLAHSGLGMALYYHIPVIQLTRTSHVITSGKHLKSPIKQTIPLTPLNKLDIKGRTLTQHR